MLTGFEKRRVTLSVINVNPHDNVRQVSEKLVDEYAADMQEYGADDWQDFWGQRMRVVEDEGRLELFSGFHTHRAVHQAFGPEHEVYVDVYDGSDGHVAPQHQTARLLATGENGKHGKKRTRRERKVAMDRWLLNEVSDASSAMSDEYIAARCEVHRTTVRSHRLALIAEGHDVEEVWPVKRQGFRDGELYECTRELPEELRQDAPDEPSDDASDAPQTTPNDASDSAQDGADSAQNASKSPERDDDADSANDADNGADSKQTTQSNDDAPDDDASQSNDEQDEQGDDEPPAPPVNEPSTEPFNEDGIPNEDFPVKFTKEMVQGILGEVEKVLSPQVGEDITLQEIAEFVFDTPLRAVVRMQMLEAMQDVAVEMDAQDAEQQAA